MCWGKTHRGPLGQGVLLNDEVKVLAPAWASQFSGPSAPAAAQPPKSGPLFAVMGGEAHRQLVRCVTAGIPVPVSGQSGYRYAPCAPGVPRLAPAPPATLQGPTLARLAHATACSHTNTIPEYHVLLGSQSFTIALGPQLQPVCGSTSRQPQPNAMQACQQPTGRHA